MLTLAVIQLGLAIYVRNVAHDAAVEGAYYAALADTSLGEGSVRAREVVAVAVGEGFVNDVRVAETSRFGGAAVEVTITTALPIIGLWGVPETMEVTGYAPVESFDD